MKFWGPGVKICARRGTFSWGLGISQVGFPGSQKSQKSQISDISGDLGIWKIQEISDFATLAKSEILTDFWNLPFAQTPPVSDRTWSFRDYRISPAPDMSESMSGLATMLRLGSVKFRHCCASFLFMLSKITQCVLKCKYPNWRNSFSQTPKSVQVSPTIVTKQLGHAPSAELLKKTWTAKRFLPLDHTWPARLALRCF